MTVFVIVIMSVLASPVQNPDTDQIDRQSDRCDQDSLIECDFDRMDKPHDGLPDHEHGCRAQKQGARVTCQDAEFTGAEGEECGLAEAAGQDIGGVADSESEGMGSHVPAVGEQGHGAGKISEDNFGDHGQGGEDDDVECSPFVFDAHRAELMGVGDGSESGGVEWWFGLAYHVSGPFGGFRSIPR